MKSKINKLFSFALITTLIGTTLHCSATNIVPVNGGNGNVAVPPSAPVTKTTGDSKSPHGGFSLQSMKSKIDEVISPRKSEAKLRDNPSGKCGASESECFWSIDTSTGVLTISGTGEIMDYSDPTNVPWYAYEGYIKTVEISNGITYIGDNAFEDCSRLESVIIGNKVISIGSFAFNGCSALTSINIPYSVVAIGDSAFSSCNNLTSVSLDSDYVVSSFKSAFPYSQITSITIGNSVTTIGNSAFKDCSRLESVIIGNNVTSIGKSTFYGCKSLTSITIPDSVISIGDYAFEGCSVLQFNEYDNALYLGNTKNPHHALIEAKDATITSCNINENTKVIANCAFAFYDELKTVTIGNSVTTIGDEAFLRSGLKSVTLGNNVTSIGNRAFNDCRALTSIVIPDSVISIGDYAFEDCIKLETVTLGNSVTTIGNSAFYNCAVLTSMTIGNSVTSIGERAFELCNLTNVTIPDSVTSIGYCAFKDCGKLEIVTIGNGVTSIGDSAFIYCYRLSQVRYLGINDPGKSSKDVFLFCSNLLCVNVFENYTDSRFCGIGISKDGTCHEVSSSSSSEKSNSAGSSAVGKSSSSEKSGSTGSSAVGKSSSSEKSGSTGLSSGSNKPVSGAVLSSKPAMWFIAATALVVPAVVFSFLM